MLYTPIIIDQQQYFITCNALENIRDFIQIRTEILQKNGEEEIKLLKHYLDLGYPEAVYLSASFIDDGLTEAERDEFYFNQIKKAAELGYPNALYRYGAYLDVGDYFPEDKAEASELFKQAARLGHAQSEWIYGIECFYGLGHQPHDKDFGLEYIHRSAYRKYIQAMEFLEEKYREGKEIEKDTQKSDFFRCRLKDHDIIDLAHN